LLLRLNHGLLFHADSHSWGTTSKFDKSAKRRNVTPCSAGNSTPPQNISCTQPAAATVAKRSFSGDQTAARLGNGFAAVDVHRYGFSNKLRISTAAGQHPT
jgi:hypothetical protein